MSEDKKTKIEQYYQYQDRGGTMNLEEWEADARYDKSLEPGGAKTMEDIKAAEECGSHYANPQTRQLIKLGYLAACEVKNKEIEELKKEKEHEAIKMIDFCIGSMIMHFSSFLEADKLPSPKELYELFKTQDK